MIELLLIGWFMCGAIAACGVYAYDQQEFSTLADENRTRDGRFAVLFGCFGPIGLMIVAADTGFKHGFKIPFTK